MSYQSNQKNEIGVHTETRRSIGADESPPTSEVANVLLIPT